MTELLKLGEKWGRKIIAGGNSRRTRLHDEKGHLAPVRRILRNGSRATLTRVIRMVTGSRPQVPWISYDAASKIKRRINKDWRVLEFGSGMSTLWLGRHAGFVASVEDNALWYAEVQRLIRLQGLQNIHYQLQHEKEPYSSFMVGEVDLFDFVLVDGSFRSACLSQALPLLRPGGMVYLDNSDKDSTVAGGDMRAAEALLREFGAKRGALLETFTDFAPTQLFVEEGILLTLPDLGSVVTQR